MIDTKERYLQSEECKDVYYSNNCFKKVKPYEEKIGKDIIDFSKEEVLEFYKELESPLGTIRRINNTFIHFMKYCVLAGYCAINIFQDITTKDMQVCAKIPEKKYLDYGQVVHMASDLLNPEDSFIIMAIYEGLLDEEVSILKAKVNDINIDKSMVEGVFKTYNGKLINVDITLLKYAVESYNAPAYYSGERIYNSPSNDYIVKHIYNEASRNDVRTLYNRFNKIKSKLNCSDLSLPKLSYSGFIHKSVREAKKLGVDIYDFYKTPECEALKERYNISTNVPSKINETYKRYLA